MHIIIQFKQSELVSYDEQMGELILKLDEGQSPILGPVLATKSEKRKWKDARRVFVSHNGTISIGGNQQRS